MFNRVKSFIERYKEKSKNIAEAAQVAEDTKERVKNAVEAYERTISVRNAVIDADKEKYEKMVMEIGNSMMDNITEEVYKGQTSFGINITMFQSCDMYPCDRDRYSIGVIEEYIIFPLNDKGFSINTYRAMDEDAYVVRADWSRRTRNKEWEGLNN